MTTSNRNIVPITDLNLNKWTVLLFLLPICIYMAVVVIYGTDGPIYEDHEGLGFLIDYFEASSLSDKISALLLQATDHRPLLGYLTLLVQYKTMGHGSFLGLLYIGNLLVIGIALLHIYNFRKSQSIVVISLAVSYLTFQLIPIGHMYWSGVSITEGYVFFFSYLSLILLCKQTFWKTVLATFFAVCAIYSFSNGLAILPAALFLIFMTGNDFSSQPRNVALKEKGDDSSTIVLNRPYLIKQLLLFETVGFATAYIYFLGYSNGEAVGSIMKKLSNPDSFSIITDMIRLLGAGFTFGNVALQYVFGTLLILLSFGLYLKKYHKQKPAIAAYFIFIVGSICAICLGRISWWLLDVDANQSRYFFLSMHAWIILVMCYLDLYFPSVINKNRMIVWTGILLLMASFVLSYALNINRVIDFCWNKKKYNIEQIHKVNKMEEIPQTGGRMGNVYDNFVKVAIERGYYNTYNLLNDKKPRYVSDRLSCYVNDEVEIK